MHYESFFKQRLDADPSHLACDPRLRSRCAPEAFAQAAAGLESLIPPVGFALLALVLGMSVKANSGGLG